MKPQQTRLMPGIRAGRFHLWRSPVRGTPHRTASRRRYPSFPLDAAVDEIETVAAAESTTIMTDEQAAELSARLSTGVAPEGVAR